MGDVSYINVNGKEFTFIDTEESKVKVFNLTPRSILAYDIFVVSDSFDAYVWLMQKVKDSDDIYSGKFSLSVDDNVELGFNGATFDIAGGNEGDSFSNPITYRRKKATPNSPKIYTPTHNQSIAKHTYQVFGGSNNSELKGDWLRDINPASNLYNGYSPSFEQGNNVNFLNANISSEVNIELYIDAVFISVIERHALFNEVVFWKNKLENGYSLKDLVVSLFFSQEYLSLSTQYVANKDFVNSIYTRILGRACTDVELRYFVAFLDQEITQIRRYEVFYNFISSKEFLDKYSLFKNNNGDSLPISIKRNPMVDKDELSFYLRKAIIVVQPSEHTDISEQYEYADETAVTDMEIGLRYTY